MAKFNPVMLIDDKHVTCMFFRANPPEHQCVEGDCYNGDTPETRKFGNCCKRCPDKYTCKGGKCSGVSR